MARVQPLSDDELAERGIDVQGVQKTSGIPLNNCFRTMARKPGLLTAIQRLASAVMLEPSSVPAELKWMVAHVVSNAAGCRYCTAHTVYNGALRTSLATEKIDTVWEYRSNPLFTDAERAALELALAAGSAPPAVTNAHFVELRKYYDDDQIIDIVAVIAHFGWFNRWNDTIGSDLEESPLQFRAAHAVARGWPVDESEQTA